MNILAHVYVQNVRGRLIAIIHILISIIGPGHCHFDFAQDILFNVPNSVDYEFESSR